MSASSFARSTAGVFALALLLTAPARAQDSDKAAATNCLQIAQIAGTRVIDDQNIVFRLRNNTFYNNHLPRKCGGLKSADKFRYKTSQSVLCNVDMITVLTGSGQSMMDGATCGLGQFTPTENPDKKPAQVPAR